MRAVEGHALGRDEAAGPPRAPAQQVLVETHRRVRAEADGDAFVRLVLAGELRADARLEEGKSSWMTPAFTAAAAFFSAFFSGFASAAKSATAARAKVVPRTSGRANFNEFSFMFSG